MVISTSPHLLKLVIHNQPINTSSEELIELLVKFVYGQYIN